MNVRAALSEMSEGAEMSRFYLSWATCVDAGLPLLQALPSLRHANSPRGVLLRIKALERALREGWSLGAAVTQRDSPFSDLEASLIDVGEKSGRLVEILRGLAAYFERDHRTAQLIRRKTLYPMFVAFVGSFMVLLPLAFWFSVGLFLILVIAAWLAFAVLGGGLILTWFRRERSRPRWAMSRFCRVLAVALESSISTPEALALAGRVVAPSALARALERLASKVAPEVPLSEGLATTELVPHTVLEMLKTAEQTGETSRTLRAAADMWETGVLD